MSLKAVSQHTLSQMGGLPVQTPSTPRSLLSQVQAIAQPVCVISPREAFSDNARQTVCTDGSLVQTMRDASGNGYNAAQSTSGYRPTFRATGLSNQFPALDFQANNPPNGGIIASELFANVAFSAGYTIYIVASSPGTASDPDTFTLSGLVSISNGDYLTIQGSGNGLVGKFNGGATGVSWLPSSTTQDYSGVYVMAYDGAIAVVGKNGQYKTGSVAGTVPTSGDLCIGNVDAYVGNGSDFFTWYGLVGDVWVFAGRHTQAQMDAIGALLAADSGLLVPSFLFIGDSQTEGYGTAQPSTMNYGYQLCQLLGANSSNSLYNNFGTSGEDLATMITDATGSPWLRTGVVSTVRGNQNIAFIWGGTNDMAANVDGVSAVAAFLRLQTLCALYRSSGCKVAVGTCLPRNASTAGTGFDATRLAFNQMIYTAGSSLYDILLDFGGNAIMGPASALANTALYQSDQIHPTEQGQAVLAQVAAQAVSEYYSATPLLQIPGNIWPAGAYPGSAQMQLAPGTLTGTTAGVVSWTMPDQSPQKKTFAAYFNAYENHTASNQTITFPTAFINTPAVVTNGTGLTISVSTTALTITAPNNTTTYSGNVIVEGF